MPHGIAMSGIQVGVVCLALAVALLPAGVAAASQAQATERESELDLAAPERWSLSFEPSLWAPGLSGDVRLPGGTGTTDFEHLRVDDPEITPFGELHFRHGKLTISFSGFGFSLNETARPGAATTVGGVTIPAGGPGIVDLDLFSAQGTVGWRVVEHVLGERETRDSVTMAIDVYGGVRGYDLDVRIASAGGMSQSSDGWVEPIVGARLSAEVLEDFTIDLTLDAGAMPLGDHSSASFDINVGVQWRPLHNLGVQFGWRQIILDLRDGDGAGRLDFEGTLAGVYGSIVFRF